MPPYKEQGVVLRSHKLGEADKIITVMTQGSGKVRAVAKGIRKTTSRFGARLEPFTHVNLMLYRGRGSLDTVTQAEIIAPHMAIREDLARFAAGETMLEAVDKVAEEHEKNLRVTLLLLAGCRALDARPADPAAVAESFMLKLLSLSGSIRRSRRVRCAANAIPSCGPPVSAARSAADVPSRARPVVRAPRSTTWRRWRSPTSTMRAPRSNPTPGCARSPARCSTGSPNSTWSDA